MLVYFEENISPEDMREKIQEVKDATDMADLPDEAEDPRYRQFKSAEKAIIDIGLYLEGVELLYKDRQKLQKHVLHLMMLLYHFRAKWFR